MKRVVPTPDLTGPSSRKRSAQQNEQDENRTKPHALPHRYPHIVMVIMICPDRAFKSRYGCPNCSSALVK